MVEEEPSGKPLVTRRIVGRRLDGVTVFDDDPMDGGVSVEVWTRLWNACHEPGFSGLRFVAWPDGKALLEQPAIVVEMFDVLTQAAELARERRKANAGVR